MKMLSPFAALLAAFALTLVPGGMSTAIASPISCDGSDDCDCDESEFVIPACDGDSCDGDEESSGYVLDDDADESEEEFTIDDDADESEEEFTIDDAEEDEEESDAFVLDEGDDDSEGDDESFQLDDEEEEEEGEV